MKEYEIYFMGRKRGAIGIFYKIKHKVIAKNKDEAILKLYDEFDHISQIKILSEKPLAID